MKNVLFIIQARMGSTRLPGKVLMELLPGKPLLACLIQRLQISKFKPEIVIATSDLAIDEPIATLCKSEKLRVFRGSESDVLARFVGAAAGSNSEVVVRLCADSPLHDATVIDKCLAAYLESEVPVDYVSNMHPESYPYGMAVEVFARDVLHRLDRMSTEAAQREHVTPLVYTKPELFLTKNVCHETDLSKLRFAVDYPEDFEFAKSVYEKFGTDDILFKWEKVIGLHPTD